MRKIQFFPTFIQPKSNEVFPVFFMDILTVKIPSAVAMCDLKANQLIKKKANSQKALCSAEAFFTPL